MIVLVTNRPEWVAHGVRTARDQTVGWPVRVVLHGITARSVRAALVGADEVLEVSPKRSYVEALNAGWPRHENVVAKWDDHDLYATDWIEQALRAKDRTGVQAVLAHVNVLLTSDDRVVVTRGHVTVSGGLLPGWWIWQMDERSGTVGAVVRRELTWTAVSGGVVQRNPRGAADRIWDQSRGRTRATGFGSQKPQVERPGWEVEGLALLRRHRRDADMHQQGTPRRGVVEG